MALQHRRPERKPVQLRHAMDELKGRVAIVTGAASGIGRSVAELFVREGAAGLTLADIQASLLQTVASGLRNDCGCDLLVSETDVSEPDQVDRMVQATAERFGRIDILVNNAGICPMVPWDRTTLESWNRMLSVNLTSAFLCSKA
ncbi:MAG: SDR family NAD(P)-dependent oxidoreductase, partial [Acidobacteria bacterium]|nr:SDR family NAD(P)-dependent oxidoreductase [Acidobacteriota bacterium]